MVKFEIGNRNLGDMFRCLVKTASDWELVLSQAETTYSNLVNRSTGLPPFHIYTGYDAPSTPNPASLPPMFPTSASAVEYSHHIKEVHDNSGSVSSPLMLRLKPKTDPHIKRQKVSSG